ncbi:MAG: class I SAM-dependent methyltransferase [Labilithrix sp.]|nr:class I SAM-dependent methyltransferase [Labilithrix sp.]
MKSISFTALVLLAVACGDGLPPPVDPSAKGVPAKGAERGAVKHVTNVEVPVAIRAIVDAPDRDADDKALDAGRKPAELLAFAGVQPGMKVADIAAGRGYTSELLARAVGPSGVVYGHNTAWIVEKFADPAWSARLAKPINKNVVKVTRELDDPLPPEAKDLDAVFMVLVYHDTYWFEGVDRAKMNAAIMRALKPGGQYVVVDHSGRAGTGASEVKTIHRIEESALEKDILAAGFELAADASFLRSPADTRDWNAAPFAAGQKRGTSDRFVLSFVKP